MMKKNMFGPLILLLIIAVNQRNISANPVASPGGFGMSGGASPAAEMNEIEDILIEAMKLLKDKMLSSQFEHAVFDLVAEMSNLPFELPVDKVAMLSNLYIAQTRLVQLRTTLRTAAGKLQKFCEGLLSTYAIYGPMVKDTTDFKELLEFGTTSFLQYAKHVKSTLKDAKAVTIVIQDLLSTTKVFLNHLNTKLTDKVNTIELQRNNEVAIQNNEVCNEPESKFDIKVTIKCTQAPHVCVITIHFKDPAIEQFEGKTCSKKKQQSMITKLNEQLNDIRPAQNAAATLDSYVIDVRNYLTRELDLIINWEQSLGVSINDVENNPLAKLKLAISGIKSRLGDLIQACKDYLAHNIPVSLIN